MSYKVSLILSMVFVVMFFLFAGDMISLQFAYSNLDSKAITISHLISESVRVDQRFINEVKKKFEVEFYLLNTTTPYFGDVVDYIVAKEYKSIVISNKAITLSVQRSSVVGYYN